MGECWRVLGVAMYIGRCYRVCVKCTSVWEGTSGLLWDKEEWKLEAKGEIGIALGKCCTPSSVSAAHALVATSCFFHLLLDPLDPAESSGRGKIEGAV